MRSRYAHNDLNLLQVWKQVNADYGSSNKGAAVRLKSTMLELFIDLVVCLEDKIGQYPQVAEASPQLLEQSIYGGWDENPELRESGLDLLGALLVLDPGGYEKFQVDEAHLSSSRKTKHILICLLSSRTLKLPLEFFKRPVGLPNTWNEWQMTLWALLQPADSYLHCCDLVT